jgi:hypothetical protein
MAVQGGWKKDQNLQKLDNNTQISFWKQKINGEQKKLKEETAKKILRMNDVVQEKNSYINIYKSKQGLEKFEIEDSNPNFVYDQVMKDRELLAGGGIHRNKILDQNDPRALVQHGYIQKSKRESLWTKQIRPREAPKDVQNVPLTSNQVIGWRKPIDNLNDLNSGNTFNRSGICWRTFNDNGHL